MATNSLLTLIILVGAIQGFIVAGILLGSTGNTKLPNRFLAALIALISIASLGVYLMLTGVKYTSATWMTISQVVPFFIIMPIGPLIYLYVRSFSSSAPKNYGMHFAPVMIDVVPQVLFILFLSGVLPTSFNALNSFVDAYDTYADIPRWASVTFYLVLSWRFLKTLNQKRADEFKRVKWLKQFVKVFLLFQVVWFCHLVPYVIPSLRNPLLDSVGWFPVYIPLTVLIYYFGIKGILVSNSSRVTSNLVDKLSPERINFVLARLKQAMTNDKLYLEPSLTVASVSKHLKIPGKEISSVLNQVESKSFNEFVNYYRVQDFKKKVYDSRLKFLTISGIALECGFNSQATFQRTFKQLEGMSPTEYFNLHRSEARISA